MFIPVTPETVPSPPVNLQGEYDFEDDQVRLTWDPPKNFGDSKITLYIVERCAGESDSFREVGTAEVDNLSFFDSDVLTNRDYIYRVLALNDNGLSEPSTHVIVATNCLIDLPDPPEGPLHVAATTGRSCTLSWRQPISGPVAAYSVWLRRHDHNDWIRSTTLAGHEHECTLTGLDNRHRYVFKVHSENRAGSSLVALRVAGAVALKTGGRRPDAPRGPLAAASTGPTSMSVEWRPTGFDGGSPLHGYVVWLREAGRSLWIEVGNVPADVCIFTVHDLQENHDYLVRVAALNELGQSPPLALEEPITIVRPEGVVVPPSAPVGPLNVRNVSATSMMVSWKPPVEDGGGTVETYIIEQREILEADVVKSHHETDGPDTFLIVDGLTQGHYYCFRVYAVNVAGVGEALVGKVPTKAKALSVRPPQPGAPSVRLSESRPRAVVVSWPPLDESVGVSCYLVERSRLDDEDWQLVSPPTGFRETSLVVGALFPGVEYVFRVSAENDHGVGRASRISEPISVTAGNLTAPGFSKELEDQTALAGDLVQFDVEFYGEPDPEITWLHGGERVWSAGRFEVVSSPAGGSSSLRISPVTAAEDHDAAVACHAANVAGEARTSATLSVHVRPEILSVARYAQGLSLDAGDSLSIRLPYVGSPKPSAVWLLNGRPLDAWPAASSAGVRVSFECGNARLEVDAVDRRLQGTFTLQVENQYGSASTDVLVTVSGEPDPPTNVRLSEVDTDSCLLSWEPPEDDGGSQITSYFVEKRLVESDAGWERCGSTHANQYNVYGLAEGEHYEFRVSAANIFGRSRPSLSSAEVSMAVESGCDAVSPPAPPPALPLAPVGHGDADMPLSSTASALGGHEDSYFQDISAAQQQQQEGGNAQVEIRPDFWAEPAATMSPDSCVPDTLVAPVSGSSTRHRPAEPVDVPTPGTDDTLDSVSDFSSYQNTGGYYSASPVGTVASSNDTALDMEMSELMNLMSQDPSASEQDPTVMARPAWTPGLFAVPVSSPVAPVSCTIDDAELTKVVPHIAGAEGTAEVPEVTNAEKVVVSSEAPGETKLVDISKVAKVVETPEVLQTSAPLECARVAGISERPQPPESLGVIKPERTAEVPTITTATEATSNLKVSSASEAFEAAKSMKTFEFNKTPETDTEPPVTRAAEHVELCHAGARETTVESPPDSPALTTVIEANLQESAGRVRGVHVASRFSKEDGISLNDIVSLQSVLVGSDVVATIPSTAASVPLALNDALLAPALGRDAGIEQRLSETEGKFIGTTPASLPALSPNPRISQPADELFNRQQDAEHGLSTACAAAVVVGSAGRNRYGVNAGIESDKSSSRRLAIAERIPIGDLYNERYAQNALCASATHGLRMRLAHAAATVRRQHEAAAALRDCDDYGSHSSDHQRHQQQRQKPQHQRRQHYHLHQHHQHRYHQHHHRRLRQRRFYAERTGSIFRLPSVSSSESGSSCSSGSSRSSRSASLSGSNTGGSGGSGVGSPPLGCVASGGDSGSRSSARTRVAGRAPSVSTPLHDRLVAAGDRVKLTCAVDGFPCAEVTWYRDGEPLQPKGRHFVTDMLDFGLCTLEIFSARATDSGEYSVIARNEFGCCVTSAYLRVAGGREQTPEPPSISCSSEYVCVVEGAALAELRWSVSGWPQPVVRLYHEDKRLYTNLRRDVIAGNECCVRISCPSQTDYGTYTCVAANYLGRAAGAILLCQKDAGSGDRSSLVAPESRQMDPLAEIATSTRNRDRNLPLGFYDPDVVGGPFPEYVEDLFERPVCWFRTHNVPFLRNLQRSVKELPELRKLPWPPRSPKFTEIDRNSVTICWEKPMNDGGAKVFDFRVEAREIHTRNWREKATSRASIATVYGLKPGTTYVFRISARNKYGEGQAQVTEPVTTRVY